VKLEVASDYTTRSVVLGCWNTCECRIFFW